MVSVSDGEKKNNPRRHNNDLITEISLADTSECPTKLIFHKVYKNIFVDIYINIWKRKTATRKNTIP